MEMNELQIGLITVFNVAVCILLPRLLTMDWSRKLGKTTKA